MAEIITDGSQKELKKHGSDEFPLLVSYEKLSGYKSGSFLWHWHPEIEITLVLDGQILYKVNQCTYHMKAGDILLGNANVLHAGFMEDMKDGKYVSITFLPKIIYGPTEVSCAGNMWSHFYTISPFLQSTLTIRSPGMKFFRICERNHNSV